MAETVTVRAPAKINLVLEVTGRRPDGYHEIDTVLQELGLADEVTLQFSSVPGVDVSGPFAEGAPAGPDNLAWRAAEALARRAGRSVDDLRISLVKRIPAAGGLGGGASDAAAVIRALGARWDVPFDTQLEAAAAVGSDEPFFLVGGTARARGRGERVEALAPLGHHHVVLFMPATTLERKTARLFEALGRTPFDEGGRTEAFARRDSAATLLPGELFNAFERVAFDLFPGLRDLHDALQHRIAEPVRLAGAGPTLFWIGTGAAIARRTLEAAEGLPCTPIATVTAAP